MSKPKIKTGDYHFIYAKTYNKSTGTSLDIFAPKKEQLTGREAHERVEQILNETVDLSLWYGLLAEQGKSTAPAQLKDSAGLAHALDEAAGSSASGQEDTGLYNAVQAEYQKYYTLKAGKAQFASLEKEAEKAGMDRDAARDALAEVEHNAGEQERIRADVRRRNRSLPELEAKVKEHEESWNAVSTLKQELELGESQLEAATTQLEVAKKTSADRKALIEAVGRDEALLEKERKKQEPLQHRADELKKKSDSATLVADDKRKRRNEARRRQETARADLEHLEDLARLANAEKQLHSQKELSAKLQAASKTLNQVKIDDQGLEKLRQLDRTLELARQKRDLAATKVVVKAERALELEIDSEQLALDSAEVAERTVAAGMDIRLPGIASVRIAPPHSAAELEAGASDAEENFRQALERYAVASLEEAAAQNAVRRSARQQVEELKGKLEDILGDDTPEEIDALARSLRERTDAYRKDRKAGTDLPESASDARELLAAAEQALKEADEAVEDAREQESALKNEQAEADSELRAAAGKVVALEATLNEKQKRLAEAREETNRCRSRGQD